ncbi:hypothetical protein HK101_004050, partial [Irineochytrium annulatum]
MFSVSALLAQSEAQGVSILRPLKGVDNALKENLASSFRLQYPKYEILFSVADKDDPAIAVVNELKAEYPNVDATLIIGECIVGVNPKVNNLMRPYDSAKYEILWILDSNVFVLPHCLGRSVDALNQPNIGLVHHVPIGIRPSGYGSYVERAFLNTAHAKMYITINKASVSSCIVGKSNLFRKADLERCGGLRAFGVYMSEDNIIATAIWHLGLRHAMTADVAFQPLGRLTFSDYFQRRARWIRVRKYTVTAATLVEPLTECFCLGLLAAHALRMWFAVPVIPFLALHVIAWFCVDLTIVTTLDPTILRLGRSKAGARNLAWLGPWTVAWIVRELMALPIYLHAFAGSTVEWRGARFRLNVDGTVEQATSSTSPFIDFMAKAERPGASTGASEHKVTSRTNSSKVVPRELDRSQSWPTELIDPIPTSEASPTTTATKRSPLAASPTTSPDLWPPKTAGGEDDGDEGTTPLSSSEALASVSGGLAKNTSTFGQLSALMSAAAGALLGAEAVKRGSVKAAVGVAHEG